MDTLTDLLSSQATLAPAVLYGDDVLTYGDLDARSTQVAHALIAAGVRPGDVVCQILASCPQLIVNLFGILKSGAMYAPLNPALTRPELAAQLDDCHPSLVIIASDGAGHSRELVPKGSRVWPTEDLWSTSVEMPLLPPSLPIDPDGPAFLFYTSGTTGRAKGVQLSHRKFLGVNARVWESLGKSERRLIETAAVAEYATALAENKKRDVLQEQGTADTWPLTEQHGSLRLMPSLILPRR